MQVVIADDEPITRMDLKEILEKEGHQVVAEAADGFDAIECCRDCHPDLVVMDVKMPLLDGITASKVIAEEDLAETVVLLTAYCDREFIEEAKEAKVSGYFVKPVEERTFLPGLEIAVDRSREMKKLQKECRDMTKRLESRAVVEQAKGLIMNKRGMTEQEAYDYIRNISRMKNISMKKVAEIILMGRGK
ncbi:response regulator [Lachnoclostridium sp. An196]|uniref:ANTAR domain-containing response regulator n=1 Tax=Lachnoclostridium sp. An196 TaxID=1965583 RepID=UPI000B38F5A6|nr:response regulator [Lachnoclostridium sp. An196]OUP22491.1 response regulator [Lachnoclostridium sp. An196]